MQKYLSGIALLVGCVVTGTIFSSSNTFIIFPEKTFYSLVTAEKLDNRLLIENNAGYCLVNGRHGDDGKTPLHLLVERKDATIQQVEALLKRGANPRICTRAKIQNNGDFMFGDNVYQNSFKCKGNSPQEMDSDEDLYHGNKEVRNYIFCVMLYKKLFELASREEEKQKQKENPHHWRHELW
jgi:hypothetical protein